MNINRLLNLENSTESAATSLDAGSKDSDCEPTMVDPAPRRLPRDMSSNDPADIREPIIGFGTPKRRPPSSTGCAIHEPNVLDSYSIRQSGNVILNPDGKIIAWTTNPWAAQVISKLLNENEGLLR